jgi:hypothetical protein
MKLKDLLNEALKDMMGKKCKTCGKGVYRETTVMDDMHGILHCNKCDAVTERYIDNKSTNSKKDTNSKKELDTIKDKVILWSKSQRKAKHDSLEMKWFKEFDDDIKKSKTKDEIKKVILGMYYMGNFDWEKLGLDK